MFSPCIQHQKTEGLRNEVMNHVWLFSILEVWDTLRELWVKIGSWHLQWEWRLSVHIHFLVRVIGASSRKPGASKFACIEYMEEVEECPYGRANREWGDWSALWIPRMTAAPASSCPYRWDLGSMPSLLSRLLFFVSPISALVSFRKYTFVFFLTVLPSRTSLNKT